MFDYYMVLSYNIFWEKKFHTEVKIWTSTVGFPKGQRDRSSFIVPGQRDNGTSSKSCHGSYRDRILTCCNGTWRHFDSLFFPLPEGKKRRRKNSFFLSMRYLVILSRDVAEQRSLSRDFCSGPLIVLLTKGLGEKDFFVPLETLLHSSLS
jgi:hypothetical protein